MTLVIDSVSSFFFKISSFLDFLKRVCIWIEIARQQKVSLEGESFLEAVEPLQVEDVRENMEENSLH